MTLDDMSNIMWGMATGETFPATLLGVGDTYHDPGKDVYFRVVAIERFGSSGIVKVFREDGSDHDYDVTSPVVIVHYADDPTVPPATDFEFDQAVR